jgi:heptosyltransferase-1
MTPRRILVIRTSAFGDVVQTFYVISDMRRALPSTRIDWCVDERFADLARLHPSVNEVIAIPTRRWRGILAKPYLWPELARWIWRLRHFDFDVSLDLQGLYKSALVGWLGGVRLRFGPDAFSESELGVHRLYNRQHRSNKAQGLAMRPRYFAGVALGYDAYAYPMESGIRKWSSRLNSRHLLIREPDIFIVIGASKPEKTWPIREWITLTEVLSRQHGLSIELLWGSDSEHKIAKSIPFGVPAPRIYSVQELRDRFLVAKVVIGGDTGLTHLAVALGTPTVMLFLATKASFYSHPELTHQWPLDSTESPVTADRVLSAVQSALKSETP